MTDLTCPKCQSPMRSYERSGVIVDRCTECGGMFLDRGELEVLISREGSHEEPRSARFTGHDRDRDHEEERHHEEEWSGARQRKRGGLLGSLMDFGGD